MKYKVVLASHLTAKEWEAKRIEERVGFVETALTEVMLEEVISAVTTYKVTVEPAEYAGNCPSLENFIQEISSVILYGTFVTEVTVDGGIEEETIAFTYPHYILQIDYITKWKGYTLFNIFRNKENNWVHTLCRTFIKEEFESQTGLPLMFGNEVGNKEVRDKFPYSYAIKGEYDMKHHDGADGSVVFSRKVRKITREVVHEKKGITK